jgi:hypothetical protein
MSRMEPLKFTVKENGKSFSSSQMTEPECYAIQEQVENLLPKPQGDYWFEVDTCLLDYEGDEDPDFMWVWCYKQNPNPKNGSLMESRLPAPLPKELLDAMAGKTFRVQPTQYGLSPWGETVEIIFESVEKKSGIPASHLIAEALKRQPVQ